MAFHTEIVETTPQPALAVRTTTSLRTLPRDIGTGFGAVAGHLATLGQEPEGPAFIGYFNDDMDHLEVEIGFLVPRETPGAGPVVTTTIPGGSWATTYHRGPYTDLEATYTALVSWIAQHGRRPAGTMYEFYLNSPDEVPASQLLTRVSFLLA